MNGVSLNCTKHNIAFGNEKKAEKKKPTGSISGAPLPYTKRLNMSPLAIAGVNGFCWFGVGMAFDKLIAKVMKAKTNTKLSLALQGAFGLFMGYKAYKVAKKEAQDINQA